jgi:hypothetical protein
VRRDPTPKLVRYLSFGGYVAMLLMPIQAAGQQPNFQIKADVRVREDSFACKEISDLDRLLQINQRGGFTSGTQLYVYLQRHNCTDSLKGARVCTRTRDNMFASTIRRTRTRLSSLALGQEGRCC